MLDEKNKYLIVIGIIFCIVIAVMSPFIASSHPDGLEKSAEDSGVKEVEAALKSPLPDYSYEPLGKMGEILALVLGGIITLAVGFGVAYIVKRSDR